MNALGRKRIKILDLLKLLAIFLVIWGHTLQYFQQDEAPKDAVYRFIYSFHMPLFMTLAGFFSAGAIRLSFRDLLMKKACRLLLPALVCSSLIWMVYQLTNQEKVSVWARVQDFAWMQLTDFWFLKSCFLCYVLFYLATRIKGKSGLWLMLLVSQLKNFLFLSVMFPCFVAGVMLQKKESFRRLVKKNWLVFLLLFLLLSVFWDETYLMHQPGQTFCWTLVAKRLFTIVIGLSGSLSLIGLSMNLSPKVESCPSKSLDVLSGWGSLTLGIYLLQSIIIEHLMAPWVQLDSIGFIPFHFVVTPLVSLAVMLVCIALIRWIGKSKWASFFLLGEKLR